MDTLHRTDPLVQSLGLPPSVECSRCGQQHDLAPVVRFAERCDPAAELTIRHLLGFWVTAWCWWREHHPTELD